MAGSTHYSLLMLLRSDIDHNEHQGIRGGVTVFICAGIGSSKHAGEQLCCYVSMHENSAPRPAQAQTLTSCSKTLEYPEASDRREAQMNK